MSHPLQESVRAVGRRSQRLLVLYGVCCFFTVLFAVLLAAGWVDYLGRFRDPGIRIILSASMLVLAIWSCQRFLAPVLRHRYTNLQVARHIERTFPELRDRLSSSIEFLEQGAAATGSAELRRSLVSETNSLASQLDLHDSIDSRMPRRALVLCLLTGLLVGGAFTYDRQSAWLAVQRLVLPWSQQAWPRRHALALSSFVPRVAAGQDFEWELIDRSGRLPNQVTAEYWFEGDDSSQIVSRQMKRLGDRMVDQLANVSRSFRVRAVGGDDDTMPWQPVQVVEPPRVLEFTIQVSPPAYTGWPSGNAGRQLRVMAGTQLSLRARVNTPLKTVQWHGTVRHQPAQIAAVLDDDGLGFTWPAEPFVAEDSGSFWFELCDREGVANDGQLRCELQIVRDAPPTVSVESPGPDAACTPAALVQLKATVKDDLAIDTVSLYFGDREVELDSGLPLQSDTTGRQGDWRVVEYVWDLSELTELHPGDVIEFHLTARDFKPQAGHSAKRRLKIVSNAEIERRVGQRQTAIRQQLFEALRVQRNARVQLGTLDLQLQQAGHLSGADLESLKGVELQQRNVRLLLQNEQDGALALVEALRADARSNRIQSGGLEQELAALAEQIGQLAAADLVDVERKLRNLLADISDQQHRNRLQQGLREAGQGQAAAITQLERMVGEFEHRDSYRQFARDARQIGDQQQELAQAVRDLDTVGRTHDDLTAEQRAALRQLALRQRELARRFDRLRGAIEGLADRLAGSERSVSDTLERALQVARAAAVDGLMREAAVGMQRNQLGRVGELHPRIDAGLDAVIDALSRHDHQPPANTDRRPDSWSQLAAEIRELVLRQDRIVVGTDLLRRRRSEQGARLRPSQLAELRQLAADQRDLRQDTAAAGTSSTATEVFSFGLQAACREMARAVARLDQGLPDQLALDAQTGAARRLQSLYDALTDLADSGEAGPERTEDQHRSEPERVRLSELKVLKRMQEEINRRTIELDQLRDAAGRLPIAAQDTLSRLEVEQGRLSAIVLRLVERRGRE